MLIALLQIFLRRRIRHNSLHFVVANLPADSPELTAREAWTLAVIARYLMELQLPVNVFRPPEFRRVAMLRNMLLRDWNLKKPEELLPTINHLRAAGHRQAYAERTSRPADEFLAWDLTRVILLAWAGVNLGWLSPTDFEAILLGAGPELQNAFSSWPDAAASYEAGLKLWAVEIKSRKIADRSHITLQTLLQHPDSPWKRIEWRTPLTATIAA